MASKPIAHLYAKIESITKDGHPYVIAISDGSTLLMPPSSWEHSVSRMADGDRILIDLENWEPKGWADVAVFRDGRFVTVFGIGNDVCKLKFSEHEESLEELQERLRKRLEDHPVNMGDGTGDYS